MAFGGIFSVEFFGQFFKRFLSELSKHLLLSLASGCCSTGLENQSSGKHFVGLINGRRNFSVVMHTEDLSQIIDWNLLINEGDIVLFLAIRRYKVST